jgi:hypothetical protein
MLKIQYFALALPLLLLADVNVEAFSTRSSFTPSKLNTVVTSTPPSFARPSSRLGVASEFEGLADQCNITPEGYGFSSTVERVMKNANRASGYYRATSLESVTDVMDGITSGQVDVALVFEETTNKLLGIFTESDYIKVCYSTLRDVMLCYARKNSVRVRRWISGQHTVA